MSPPKPAREENPRVRAWAEVRTHGEVAPARAWHRCAVEDDGRGGILVFGGGGKDGAQKGVWSLRGLAVG